MSHHDVAHLHPLTNVHTKYQLPTPYGYTQHFQITGQNTEKMSKKVTWVSVYGPHTQVKCLLKALVFSTCKKNIIMYSQMGFQLYQSHRLTVTGLKSGKMFKYWVSVGLLETSM